MLGTGNVSIIQFPFHLAPFLFCCYHGSCCTAQCRFHCLFCHGFEERGCEAAGVLAIGDIANPMAAMHVARMARRFATTVTIYTHGSQEVTRALEKATYDTGIKVDSRPITRLVKGPGPSDVDVEFEDGTHRMEGFLVSICRDLTVIDGDRY